jgi:hypothetical protein
MCVKIQIFSWSHWTFFCEGEPLLHVSNVSFYCYHLSCSFWLLVEHDFKHLHRVFGFLGHFGDICDPLFWTLWGVWTWILCGLQFLHRERRMHSGIFRFLNFLSIPPNVSSYFDWCLLTCAQQSNDLSMSPLVCICLPPSLLFYMCVYGFVQLFYLIFPPLPSPIVNGFLTSTSLENPNS